MEIHSDPSSLLNPRFMSRAFSENRILYVLGDFPSTCRIHSQWRVPPLPQADTLPSAPRAHRWWGFPVTDQRQMCFSVQPFGAACLAPSWVWPPPLQGELSRSCFPGGGWSMEGSVCGAGGKRLTGGILLCRWRFCHQI